jgi:putative membrane protein
MTNDEGEDRREEDENEEECDASEEPGWQDHCGQWVMGVRFCGEEKTNPVPTMKTSFANMCVAMAATFGLAVAASAAGQEALVNGGDEKFIKTAAANGLTELMLAELAVQKASKAEVKELAQMLVTDHTAMNDSLKALAESKKVMLSAIIEPSGAAAFQRLEKFFGEAFDDAFLNRMKDSHEKSVTAFKDASEEAKDADVKVFVEKNLPTLQAHLDKVKKLLPPEEPSATSPGP